MTAKSSQAGNCQQIVTSMHGIEMSHAALFKSERLAGRLMSPMTNGTVVAAPTISNATPADLRWSRLRRPESRNPSGSVQSSPDTAICGEA